MPTYLTGSIQAKAYRILRSDVYDVLSDYKLTPTLWSVLGMIFEAKDGMKAADLASDLRIKAPQITVITQELLDRGYIHSVPHQFDGRAKLLAITPLGKRFIKTIETKLTAALETLLKGLTAEDLNVYNKVLTTIIANEEAGRL